MTDATDRPAAVRYSFGAIALHWLLALAIAVEIMLGLRMDGVPGLTTFAVYQLHKSVGITILALTLVRIVWRLTHRPPAPQGGKAWEHRLAGLVHAGFYGLLLLIPLSGWLLVSASSTGVATTLYGLIPWPHLPGLASLATEPREAIEGLAEQGHILLGYALYGLLALHVAGALKHHLIDRDHGLARMLPGARRTRLFDLRLLIVAVVLMAGVAAASTYPWRGTATPTRASTTADPAPTASSPDAAPPIVTSPTPLVTEAPATEDIVAPQTPAAPSRWSVDAGASSLGYRTTLGGAPITGRFGDWSADITFAPDALEASSVRVVVRMASLTTGDSESGGVLPGSQWFDVANHPQAVFEASRFRSRGGDAYEARGTLTLRGVSRPVTVRFTLTLDGDRARMSGTATLDRLAHAVGQGEWAATDEIPAEVTVDIAIRATRIAD